ncbi:hypothetical protein IFO70_24360 [Phormidium tenue FACHB-886]|nr:hypothetical protein [Phormidium tenue FACHB-886]
MEKISVVGRDLDSKDESVVGNVEVSDRINNTKIDTANDAIGDTATVSATGFTMLGLTSLALPGLGAVLAAGSLGAAIAATIVGGGVAAAAENNIIKALTNIGVPKSQADHYSSRLQQGDYLVMVEGTEDDIRQAEAVFRDRGIADWSVY